MGDLVRRVDREFLGVRPQLLSIAELLLMCGAVAPPEATTASEKELALEELFADLDLRRYRGVLETEAAEPHMYSLQPEGNAEDVFLAEGPFEALTKIALARALERILGEPRRSNWSLGLEELRGRARPLLRPSGGDGPAPAEPPTPALAKGKGRGKGGRARGARGRR